jgi:hypothetical protein
MIMRGQQGCKWSAAAVGLAALLTVAPLGAIALFDIGPGADEGPTAVFEYYDAAHDHYFATASPQEIEALDSGRIAGWKRSGEGVAFLVYAAPAKARYVSGAQALARPVCRFFVPPASHFLSASEEECEAVAAAHPEFVLETPAAFYAWLPDPVTGQCPALFAKIGGFEFQAVYRLWNGRADTNHRLTTSRSDRAAMIAAGWLPEGYGDDGVAMCVPHWYS